MKSKIINYLTILGVVSLLSISFVATGINIEHTGINIEADGWEYEYLFFLDKGEEINVVVESTGPVDVYIIKSEYFDRTSLEDSELENAEVERLSMTNTEIVWSQEERGNYYLVIVNNSSNEVTMDYSYETEGADNIERIISGFGFFCFGVFIAGLIIILVVIIFIVIFILKSIRKDERYQHYKEPPGRYR